MITLHRAAVFAGIYQRRTPRTYYYYYYTNTTTVLYMIIV